MTANRSALRNGVVAITLLLFLTGFSSAQATRNPDDGAFEGTVSRVWEDGMTLDVDGGGSIHVDTWAVCGDNTARNLSAGDSVRVYASRDLIGYDAWRILDAEGQPACDRSAAAGAPAGAAETDVARPQRTADDGAFEGTVSRVWEDGLNLDVDGGGSIRVDTWAVCGDNTARNISRGDQLRVYASRSLFSYDAWRILDAGGQPACGGTGAASSQSDSAAGESRARRNADDGAFEGTVSRVWEDGLNLDVDGGGSIRIDTWDVCGDNTARNISRGDRLRVYASRSFFSYDAWRILDEAGQPACGRAMRG